MARLKIGLNLLLVFADIINRGGRCRQGEDDDDTGSEEDRRVSVKNSHEAYKLFKLSKISGPGRVFESLEDIKSGLLNFTTRVSG
ncbi:MAG: hypothetical protein AB1797_11315 [bacterium]